MLEGGSTKVRLPVFFAEQEYGFAGAANCFAHDAAAKQSGGIAGNCFAADRPAKQSADCSAAPWPASAVRKSMKIQDKL